MTFDEGDGIAAGAHLGGAGGADDAAAYNHDIGISHVWEDRCDDTSRVLVSRCR